jgi:hypothetical protein
MIELILAVSLTILVVCTAIISILIYFYMELDSVKTINKHLKQERRDEYR